jgi:hypothetical protein
VPKVLDQLKPVPSQPINTFGTPLSLLGPLRETCSSWHGMFLPVAGKRKTTPGVSIRGVDWGRGVNKLVIGYLSRLETLSYIF